jgi:hypothetical protein
MEGLSAARNRIVRQGGFKIAAISFGFVLLGQFESSLAVIVRVQFQRVILAIGLLKAEESLV